MNAKRRIIDYSTPLRAKAKRRISEPGNFFVILGLVVLMLIIGFIVWFLFFSGPAFMGGFGGGDGH
jgi:hypothetical protein